MCARAWMCDLVCVILFASLLQKVRIFSLILTFTLSYTGPHREAIVHSSSGQP